MIALWLIALHALGDFVTQTPWMAAHKLQDWRVRGYHVTVYTLPFVAFGLATLPIQQVGLWIVAVWLPHFIIDCRRWASPDPWPPKPIMVDQALHLLHLAVVGTAFYGLR